MTLISHQCGIGARYFGIGASEQYRTDLSNSFDKNCCSTNR